VGVSIPEPVQDYSEPKREYLKKHLNPCFNSRTGSGLLGTDITSTQDFFGETFQFPNRFRITRNENHHHCIYPRCNVSIPEPVQDYSELPLFEPVAAQGVQIAKIRTYFENHKFPSFCKHL